MALGLVSGLWASAVQAETLYFPHADEHFLYRHQHNGGAAWLPEPSGEAHPLPLVVFLHGTNPSGHLHKWFGGGGRDLRPLAEGWIADGKVEPFAFAAPSHSKNAHLARTVWRGFNLNSFVDDVIQAAGGRVEIDRERVVLAGHSGAGCNPTGGLAGDFWSSGDPTPLALVSVDTCLDRKMGRAFARRPADVPLFMYFQSAVWTRQPVKFGVALAKSKPEGRVDRLLELPARGVNPHEAIVPTALQRALHELLGHASPL